MSDLCGYLFAYFINSLWQAPLLYLSARLAGGLVKDLDPESRHRLWVATFLAQILLPAICLAPFPLLPHPWQGLWTLLHWGGPRASSGVETLLGEAHPARMAFLPPSAIRLAAAVYAGSVMLFALRLFLQMRSLRSLRRRASVAVLPVDGQAEWQRMKTCFGLPRAELRSCPDLSGPVTIGIVHKLVVVPERCFALPPADLRAAFAHEFAHMERSDFGKNLFYEVLFLLTAYHPCVRLSRAWIAETREMVCDRRAARALNDTRAYAHSLLRLASFCLSAQPVTLPQAIGIFDANTLQRRVMSLHTRFVRPSRKQRILALTASAALLCLASGSALAFHIAVPATGPQAAAPAQVTHVASGVMAGQVVSRVSPIYPAEAKQAHIEGSVVLAARIGTDGHIDQLTVVSGPEELQRPALDAVKEWVYEPFLLNGTPVPVDTTITVNFRLND